ncbi:MAG: hypothetical protein U5R48_14955 [Gammaproteobacteria bacterium]|nr:hypothetical protein [Gammaproteobacteria bacterium]
MREHSAGVIRDVMAGRRPDRAAALALAAEDDLPGLVDAAGSLRDAGFGNVVTYSRKVFIPLTHLCRDVCHYCTFATTPKRIGNAYLPHGRGAADRPARAPRAGCKEALFTLGEKPELRYRAAREALAEMGHETTLDYLEACARAVYEETGLLPHLNPGNMTPEEMQRLRAVSASMGIMLESTSERLTQKGMPHYGSPDKVPGACGWRPCGTAGPRAVPFDHRHPDRHRRDPHASGSSRCWRSATSTTDYGSRPGDHRPELPRQAGHEDGKRAGTGPERDALDPGRGAHRLRPGDEHPGAAQPFAGRAAEAGGGRHQRLGRRLAGDPGLRQSRGPLAPSGEPGPGDGRLRQAPARAPDHLSRLGPRSRNAGWTRPCAPPSCA